MKWTIDSSPHCNEYKSDEFPDWFIREYPHTGVFLVLDVELESFVGESAEGLDVRFKALEDAQGYVVREYESMG